MMRGSILAGAMQMLAPAIAAAAPITVTKTMTVVSDGTGALKPRVLPGAILEFVLEVQNPPLNPVLVTNVKICDVIPESMAMRVVADGDGSWPVVFADGGIAGLLGSGLSYSQGTLASTTDGIAFSDGTAFTYTPVSTGGYDGGVREICMTLTGTRMATGSGFKLRYRVKVK